MATATRKLGVYLCRGCTIGEAVDIEKLAALSTGELKADLCRVHGCLCSPEGVDLIRRDLASEGVNAVAIAACSPRVNTEVFRFEPTILVERVNLREQVAWCQEPRTDDTQMLAEDYLRMAVARLRKTAVPEPHLEPIDKTILVVGGGLAGLTAAWEAAQAGYPVVLIEKEAHLGGWMRFQHRQVPTAPPYRETQPVAIDALVGRVQAHPGIAAYTSAELQSITGGPGVFDVTFTAAGQVVQKRVGAIVQATGAESYDPTRLGKLGFGSSPNVITSDQFESQLREGSIRRPSDGQPARQVVFILCAGSRDPEHLPYCSSICCLRSLRQALDLRQADPQAKAFVIYRDIRTPGHYEDFYRRVQEDPGIFLTKGEVRGVTGADGQLTVTVDNTLLGEPIGLAADLVVLATGMVPRSGVVRDVKDTTPIDLSKSILKLAYRQGPDLPHLKYGFPDSHYICFPYETRRTGIYAAGTLRQPMGERETIQDACGAAMKAIQAVEMIARGETVHPRAGDRSVPEFFLQRCTQCKRCTEECPFGTLNEDAKGTPQPNPTRCRRCGICLGACPERIVSFKDYSPDIIGSMIKAVEVPEESEDKPRILVFACENDAYPALDMLGLRRVKYTPFVRVIPVRCLGSVNLVWIADALSKGFDAIVLIGCKYGEDYQCHFIHGSELANTRSTNIQETLNRLMLEADRVKLHQVSINEWQRVAEAFAEAVETVETVGYNPYKGM